ncbi:alpha/beta fold hydrolase [Streptomyces sp. NPDC087300]|uniref:alpha/beta fold hydrolase n=1 Tax=Streptomyces sp. NPDC087300 TaxID=3365780 RepID=UPI0038262977
MDRAAPADGAPGPTVVFVPGAGMLGLDYLNLHDRLRTGPGPRATSVLYDRAGTGWSEPGRTPLPRTAAEVTDELRALLRAAEVPGPYVLVGHSLGGLYVRHYAQRFPDEVAALLLLDPNHEDYAHRMPPQILSDAAGPADAGALPDPGEEVMETYRTQYARKLAGWPAEVRGPLVEQHLRTWRTGLTEMANVESVLYPELRAGGGLPDVPLTVLTALAQDPAHAHLLPDGLAQAMNDAKLAVHADLAASVPRGVHRALPDAEHNWIHVDEETLVLRCVEDLIRG